jgi:small ligand-binding sensory domain FIST
VRTYLRSFADGKHGSEARSLVSAQDERLRALGERHRLAEQAAQAAAAQREQAAQAKARALVIPLGRRGVLQALKSPSTASFVSDQVLYQCAAGDIIFTQHEVDSQNGFGAMVRESVCAVVSLRDSTSLTQDCSGVGTLVYTRAMDAKLGRTRTPSPEKYLEDMCALSRQKLAIAKKFTP